MKNIFRIFTVVAFLMLLSVESVWAGNDKRRGTAGATQLLVNPWARSNGWGGANVASVRGLDAFYSSTRLRQPIPIPCFMAVIVASTAVVLSMVLVWPAVCSTVVCWA